MTSSSSRDVKMAINGPVFFLIQEQAKSVVAIQALQTRMAVLESLQERLMLAIEDVHHHLTPSKDYKSNGTTSSNLKSAINAKVSSKSICSSDKKLRFLETDAATHSRSDTAVVKSDSSKSDSLNKDSGIGASESSLVPTDTSKSSDDDELLQLLDLIDQKSLVLLKQVEGIGASPENDKMDCKASDSSSAMLLDNLLFEKVDTQRQLSEVKAERDELKIRLAKLELATEAVTKEKHKVQTQLDATLLENHSLQEKIHKVGDFKAKTESLGYLADIEKANMKKKYLQYSEKSKRKVSSILKETNVLELQKQLLTYVMENDVLRAKLQQDDSNRMANWIKIESRLRKELKEALDARQNIQEMVQSKDLEIASLKDKIRSLEELIEGDSCVKNFGMGSTEDWRDPGVPNVYNKRTNLNNAVSSYSPLGYGDFSKTQSLPAMLFLDAQAKLKERENSEREKYGHVYDTGSFTEISLNQSVQSQQNTEQSSHFSDNVKDLVDLSSPMGPNYSSTTTLVQSQNFYQPTLHSGISAPNLSGRSNSTVLQNWGVSPHKPAVISDTGNGVGGAKLVNGHLCWKGASRHPSPNAHLSSSHDLSSICTEFDPLSDDAVSCENFVDSLNLSIPLKPTQVAISQLSSVGDSLHSTSLDMGCSSSAVVYQDSRKIHNARSVDGIRELLVENGYYKRPASLQYGHSSVAPIVLGKSGRHLPVNLMNCMHETSDYSLL